jgi:hypothetical protein
MRKKVKGFAFFSDAKQNDRGKKLECLGHFEKNKHFLTKRKTGETK